MERSFRSQKLNQLNQLAQELDPMLSSLSADELAQAAPALHSLMARLNHAEGDQPVRDNDRHKTLLDSILAADPGGLAVIAGPQLCFVYANPIYRYICPTTHIDLIGQPYADIWGTAQEENYLTQIEQVVQTGRPFQTTGFSRHFPDGTLRTFTLQARRLSWDNQPAALIILWDTTDLRAAQQALETARAAEVIESSRLEAVLETLPVGVSIIDPQGGIIRSNRAFEETWRGPLPLTQTVSDYVHYEAWWLDTGQMLQPEEWASARALQNGQAVIEQTLRIKRFDGSYAVVMNSAAPIRDTAGQITGCAVVIQDISERVENQERLAYQANLLANISDVVYATDEHLRITAWNHAAEELYGWQEAEVLGKSILEVVRTRIDPEKHNTLTRELDQNGIVSAEVAHESRSGAPLLLESHTLILRDSAGKVSGYVSVNRDIFERKQAEQRLAEEQEWFRTTLASIGDAVITTDRAANITFINPVAETLTGWSKSEAFGKPIEQVLILTNEQTQQPVSSPVAKVLDQGRKVDLANHTALKTRAGAVIPIEDSAAPILSADKRTLGVVMVFHDVTEKRAKEAQIRRSEERYRALFEQMTEGFALHEILLDENGAPCDYRFLDINPAFEQLTGLARDQVVGKTLTEVLPNEDPRWIQAYGQVTLSGQAAHFENYSPVLKRFYDVFAYRTAPGQFAVLFTDVTIRRLADQEREELVNSLQNALAEVETNRSRLEATFAAQSDIVLNYNLEQIVERANPIFQETYGFDPLGLHISEIIRRVNYRQLDGQPLVLDEQPTPRALRGEKITNQSFLTTRVDGSEAAVQANAGPVRVGDHLTGSITVWHDITQRVEMERSLRQSEAELRESEARYRQLVELSPDAIFIQSSGGFVFVNPATLRLFGVEQPEQILGQPVLEWIHPDSRQAVAKRIRAINADRQAVPEVEEKFLRMDGKGVDVEVVAAPFTYAGQPGALVIARDITRRKTAERVKDETLGRIEVQRRLIEQREQERAQIARDLHDGPVQELTAATFTLQMLAELAREPELVEGLHELRQALVREVGELRAFAGELRPPVLTSFGLAKTFQSHAQTFREKHPELRLNLDIQQEGPLLPEPLRIALFRIYQESLNNILKHARATKITVRFHKDHQQAELSIQDDGCGFELPEDWLELARHGHLGLVGIRERSEAIGGRLEIESRIGEGTCISVIVPIGERT